tara:strand:+ start:730 stop:2364 length:1635 start_codon:yes stop_codon:yes gene_type:complete
MLIAFIINSLILFAIFGYSFCFKTIFLTNDSRVKNIDFFYGLFLIYLLSISLNFFFKISIFILPVFLIGLIVFTFGYFKKKISIKIFLFLLIIFFSTFISFIPGNNIDSPMYHLQILKWINDEKIIFGLANLEIRFAMNNTWHNILALLNINFLKFNAKFYLSAILLSVLIYECTKKFTKFTNSEIYLIICLNFLILYSIIHPFGLGTILNHLGNPENDIVSMLFFFFAIYFFIKTYEKKENKNFIYLTFILIFFCFTNRITLIPLVLLGFFLLKVYKFSRFNKVIVLLTIAFIFWIFKSYALSGCLVFPIASSCLETFWTLDYKDILNHKNEVMSWTRGMSSFNHDNYDYTIYSNQWIVPWFKTYFFKTALLQITSLVLFASTLIFITLSLIKKNITRFNSEEYFILLSFILIFSIWFIGPEIRYAYGPIISINAFIIYIILKRFKILNKIKEKIKFLNLSTILILSLFFIKCFTYFDVNNLFLVNKKNFNYSKIYLVKTIQDKEIFKSENWQCADFKKICINKIKDEYIFKEKFNYLIIKSY